MGKNLNVHQVVLLEFQKIIEQESKELDFMNSKSITDKEKQKRLLFLFQCDLMPGITGKIMSTKLERDLTKSRTVTLRAKVFCYCVVFVINISMLYYIFLFAMNQTKYRQNAWFKSFLLWLVVEIVFVGSIVVFITHFAIPSIIMKDVHKIKERLLVNIREYQDKMCLKQVDDFSSSTKSFNAAEHLFLSNRVSKHFQHLSISKLILQFKTTYPKQSYLHVRDVSTTYNRKFSEIGSSVVNILIFLLGMLLNIPISMQDTIIHLTSTSVVGYTALLHMQLFFIYPLLAAVPTLFFAMVCHFVIQTGKATSKLRHQKLTSTVEKKRVISCEDPIIEKALNITSPNNQYLGASLNVNRRMSFIQGVNLLKSMTKQNHDEFSNSCESVQISIDCGDFGEENSPFSYSEMNQQSSNSTISSDLIQPSIFSSELIQPSTISSEFIQPSTLSSKVIASVLSDSSSDTRYDPPSSQSISSVSS
jgi:hypothetical protein